MKPCPFCGSEAITQFHASQEYANYVGCGNEECVGYHCNWFKTLEEAIEAWDKRTEWKPSLAAGSLLAKIKEKVQ